MNNISLSLKKFLPRLKGSAVPHPARDWSIILAVSVIGMLAFFVIGAYMYTGARSGFLYAPPSEESESVPNISRAALTDLVSQFEMRDINYQADNLRRPNVSDPR